MAPGSKKTKVVVWTALLLLISAEVEPCSIAGPVSPEGIVRAADAIVRVTAAEYARPPKDPTVWTTGEPDSQVRFRTIEVLKGRNVPPVIVLPGYLVDRDDFNELKAPYTFVRRGGRSGSCFANSYRQNAEFLLMLRHQTDGSYTVNWYALGPVNEQLRSEDDAWLLWVRDQLRR